MSRLIVFGDIHGCIEEWRELMEKLDVTPGDRLVSVGDLVAKGPSSRAVLDLAMSLPNLRCVMGNHELHLLNRWMNDDLGSLSHEDHRRTVEEFGAAIDRYMQYVASWPYFLDCGECLVVHAGLRPGVPLLKQDPRDLVSLRTVEPEGKPWYEYYKGEQLVVHGHWARQGLVIRDNVIGLDTGCVYGKKLTALVLPERKIVSVQAKRTYAPIRS